MIAHVRDTFTPSALNEDVRRRLSHHPRRDSRPEKRLRSALHAAGLRFFVERAPLPSFGRRRADVVFPRTRVAVYLHGCFWHGCPEHGELPRHNAEWWKAKLERTRARDRRTAIELQASGWEVVEVWEHEDPVEAARGIARIVRGRQAG